MHPCPTANVYHAKPTASYKLKKEGHPLCLSLQGQHAVHSINAVEPRRKVEVLKLVQSILADVSLFLVERFMHEADSNNCPWNVGRGWNLVA